MVDFEKKIGAIPEHTGHAHLSPSSASRWIGCPGSAWINAETTDPPEISQAAIEGTNAHEWAEYYLLKLLKETEDLNCDPVEPSCEVDWELEGMAQGYASYVHDKIKELDKLGALPNKQLYTEQAVSLEPIVKGCYGRADAMYLIETERAVIISIFDFKTGRIPVEAKHNPQMKLYAAGIMNALDGFSGVEQKRIVINLHIYQPRYKASSWACTGDQLAYWIRSEVVPTAQSINENNARKHGGPWCKYCKGKNNCPYFYTYKLNSLVDQVEIAEDITVDQLGVLFEVLSEMKANITEALEASEKGLKEATAAGENTGYCLEEKRGARFIPSENQEMVIRNCQEAGIPTEEIVEPVKVKGIAKLEKVCRSHGVDFEDVVAGCIGRRKPTQKLKKIEEFREFDEFF